MDWTDLLSQNLETTSPRTVAATRLLNTQAQGADIANQRAALGLNFEQMLANGMNNQQPDQSGVGAPGANETPLELDEAAARQHVFQNYAPLPDVWTPQEQQQRVLAALSGVPGAVDAVTAQHQTRITSANAVRAKAAMGQYNDLYGVANAPAGRAMDMLELVEPDEAARLKAAGFTDDQVRQHAAALAGITHSVSQLPMDYRADGVAVDKSTGQEIPGYDDAVGTSAKDRVDLVKSAQDQIDVPTAAGGMEKKPRWQADSAASPEAWINRNVRLANTRPPSVVNPGTPAGAPPVAAATQAAAPQVAPPTQGASPGAPPAAPPVTAARPPMRPAPPRPAPPVGSANNGGQPIDLSDAPRAPTTVGRAPATMGPGEAAQATAYATKSIEKDEAASHSLAGANYEILEAKQILNILPAASAGPGTGAFAKLQTALQNIFQDRTVMTGLLGDPGARQMLEKLLGQDAIASTEKEMSEGGAGSLRGGAQLMNLAMNKLNASPEMARQAIEAITKYQLAQAQYDRQKWGQDYQRYSASGGDVIKFGDWYDTKYPVQNVVQPIPVTGNTMPTGAKLNAYAAAHFGGDTAKAQAFLTEHGYK